MTSCKELLLDELSVYLNVFFFAELLPFKIFLLSLTVFTAFLCLHDLVWKFSLLDHLREMDESIHRSSISSTQCIH